MSEIKIVEIGLDEVDALRELAMATFTETFAHDNTAEQLQAFYDEAYSPELLAEELANPESISRFVTVDGQVAGFLKVNWGQAQTEQELDDAFEIQRIYVLKQYQGLGLGKVMFDYALQIAQDKGFTWAWLGVWERNFKAQNFYAKYGFEKFSEHHFQVTEDKLDIDWLLKKRLK